MKWFILGMVFLAVCAMILLPELRAVVFSVAQVCNDILLSGFKGLTGIK